MAPSASLPAKQGIITEGLTEGRRYLPGYLTAAEASELFGWLLGNVLWQQESLSLFGRHHLVPRRVAWYGDDGLDYRYSNRSHPTNGWPIRLLALKERLSSDVGMPLNFLLLNRYRNGRDCMGSHQDDEVGLNRRIVSLSLGADRRFLIRPEGEPRSVRMTLEHGSLLVFDGGQRHSLPRTRNQVTERINLTFRSLS